MNFVNDILDQMQFAYKKARGTDDAVLTLYNSEHNVQFFQRSTNASDKLREAQIQL